jgi:hypothetical protein
MLVSLKSVRRKLYVPLFRKSFLTVFPKVVAGFRQYSEHVIRIQQGSADVSFVEICSAEAVHFLLRTSFFAVFSKVVA